MSLLIIKNRIQPNVTMGWLELSIFVDDLFYDDGVLGGIHC